MKVKLETNYILKDGKYYPQGEHDLSVEKVNEIREIKGQEPVKEQKKPSRKQTPKPQEDGTVSESE